MYPFKYFENYQTPDLSSVAIAFLIWLSSKVIWYVVCTLYLVVLEHL